MTPTPAADTCAGGLLLERLMGVVRPEFRVEVSCPTADDPVFFSGICQVPSCPTAVRLVRIGLCETHRAWWVAAGRPDRGGWLQVAEQRLREERGLVPQCAVVGCNRAGRRHRLCIRHHDAWERAGCPPREAWTAAAVYAPPPAAERGCGYPHCPRWTDGPENPFCRIHYRQWLTAGRLDR